MAGVTVSVPATSANLGSGFDSFGLALGMLNTVSAEISSTGSWHMRVMGEGEGDDRLVTDSHVTAAMQRVFAQAGRPETAARVFCRNTVPIGGGLGSSAAAIVSGVIAANELLQRPFGQQELFEMACELEGHPDNVAAALVGGFTVCWREDEPCFVRLEPACGLAVVVVGSTGSLATVKARELLPDTVSHADAAFNVGRAGLLTAGLALGRRDLIGPGTVDRLHQPYRTEAVPDLAEVHDALVRSGADGAALSGSGPTVIGLVCGTDDAEAYAHAVKVASDAARLIGHLEGRTAPIAVGVDREGAHVVPA